MTSIITTVTIIKIINIVVIIIVTIIIIVILIIIVIIVTVLYNCIYLGYLLLSTYFIAGNIVNVGYFLLEIHC